MSGRGSNAGGGRRDWRPQGKSAQTNDDSSIHGSRGHRVPLLCHFFRKGVWAFGVWPTPLTHCPYYINRKTALFGAHRLSYKEEERPPQQIFFVDSRDADIAFFTKLGKAATALVMPPTTPPCKLPPSSPRISATEQGSGAVELVARATGSAVLVHVRVVCHPCVLLDSRIVS